MPVQKEQDEKKKQVQQQQAAQTLAMTSTRTLSPAEQAEVQRFQQREKQLKSQSQELDMKGQAQKAGEKAFSAEFKRGIETVGLMLQKDSPQRQVPEITEKSVTDVLATAQAATTGEPRTILAEYNRRMGEIVTEQGKKGVEVRQEYDDKLKAVLPGPEAGAEIAKLGEWRSSEMAKIREEAEPKKKAVESWKASMSSRTKAEVELGYLTTAVMDLYSLTPEARTKLEPAVRDIIQETRATANQALISESNNVYNQLKKESAAKGEG